MISFSKSIIYITLQRKLLIFIPQLVEHQTGIRIYYSVANTCLLTSTGFTQMMLMLIMVSTGQLVILLNYETLVNMVSYCHLIRYDYTTIVYVKSMRQLMIYKVK